jgi:hypothetical protein
MEGLNLRELVNLFGSAPVGKAAGWRSRRLNIKDPDCSSLQEAPSTCRAGADRDSEF